MTNKIFEELGKIKLNYNTRVNILQNADQSIGALRFWQKDLIRMIEFYGSSKYLNGMKDELGRDKPFYNIINGVIDVENAAKDIDTKNIEVVDQDGNHPQQASMMNKEVKEWMNRVTFGRTLNEIRDLHSRSGAVLAKKVIFTDENGKKQIRIEMPAWKNVWNDQIDILNQPIVEIHWMLPSEVMAMEGWHNKTQAIKSAMQKSTNRYRVPVYEIRGTFPESWYRSISEPDYKADPNEVDNWTYQLYYVAGAVDQEMVSLYEENNTEKVYKFLARKPKPGRSFGIGLFEEGEEAQVWTNDAILKQYRALEYSSKVVGQSASKKLKGRNMLTEVDDGQILEHEDQKPITTVPLVPPGGMAQFDNIVSQWYDQFEKASSAYSTQRGQGMLSHVPYRLQALMLQQSQSVFALLKQDLGLFLEDIFNDWILPFLAQQLTEAHILAAEFTPDELKEIDTNFATYWANQEAVKRIISGRIVSPDEYQTFIDATKTEMAKNKSRRFLSIPKDYYKDLRGKVYVLTTGEQKDKQGVLDALTNIMQIYAKNPQALQDPVLALMFKEAVAMSGVGISSVSLAAAITEQGKQQAQMAQQNQNPNPNAPPTPPGNPAVPGTPPGGTPGQVLNQPPTAPVAAVKRPVRKATNVAIR